MDKVDKVVLAYSGGLDTSVILPWLKEKYNCEVVAFAADDGGVNPGELFPMDRDIEQNNNRLTGAKIGVRQINIRSSDSFE